MIDFVCLTITEPASSWFNVVVLPVKEFTTASSEEDKKGTIAHKKLRKKYDMPSSLINNSVNKTGLLDISTLLKYDNRSKECSLPILV